MLTVVVAEPPADNIPGFPTGVPEVPGPSFDLYADNQAEVEAAFIPGHDEQIGAQIMPQVLGRSSVDQPEGRGDTADPCGTYLLLLECSHANSKQHDRVNQHAF
jgi:hypothetical protein